MVRDPSTIESTLGHALLSWLISIRRPGDGDGGEHGCDCSPSKADRGGHERTNENDTHRPTLHEPKGQDREGHGNPASK